MVYLAIIFIPTLIYLYTILWNLRKEFQVKNRLHYHNINQKFLPIIKCPDLIIKLSKLQKHTFGDMKQVIFMMYTTGGYK